MSKARPRPDSAEIGDYTVVTPVELGGKIYRPGATIRLTSSQAEHPLKVGAVKPKESE